MQNRFVPCFVHFIFRDFSSLFLPRSILLAFTSLVHFIVAFMVKKCKVSTTMFASQHVKSEDEKSDWLGAVYKVTAFNVV